MRSGTLFAITALACLAVPAAAMAQGCPSAAAAELPPELEGWATRTPLAAASDAQGLAQAMLEPGSAVDAQLVSTSAITYPVRPEKPGGSVSFGGLFAFTVAQPGTYRIGIGSGAWIDVVGPDGAVVESTAHGHGPECSGISKMVDFPLEAGSYILQIAANGENRLPVMVARLP